MKNILHVSYLLLLSIHISFGQLSGTYTIGGTSPNYATITLAIDDLNSVGLSGPVIFNIRPGHYYVSRTFGFNIASAIKTITFQSETLNSSSVIIENANQYIFSDPDYVIFNELTIVDTVYSALNYPKSITIKNCVISSPANSPIYFSGGTDTIINSFITCDINSFNSSLFFSGNLLNGDLDFDTMTCVHNLIYGNLSIYSGIADNNIVYGIIGNGYQACLIKNNTIFPSITGGISGMQISYSSTTVVNNIVYGPANFGFANYCKVIGNKFFNDVYFSSDYLTVRNNFFYKDVDAIYCHGAVFAFNSFAGDSGQYFDAYFVARVENNILPPNFHCIPSVTIVKNNNYPSFGGMYDSHPWNIDPQFVSPTDLHAQNFQLAGKGIYSSQVLYDIDSVPRPNPPTIGANEICISSDTINIYCGDSIMLSFCNLPSAGNYSWQPGYGLNDSSVARPMASPLTNTLYIIVDSISGYSDSVFLNIIPYQVQINLDTLLQCGDSILLIATYNANAFYQWSPTTGLSDSDSIHTMATPVQTTTYIVSATINGCGTSFDTINIAIDSMPRASVQHGTTGLTASFFNYSTCASNYYWYFGDGDSSTLFAPIHSYPLCGQYIATLVACNNVGCDTTIRGIYVCNVGLQEVNNLSNLKYYPNPTNGNIILEFEAKHSALANLQIKITDILGQETISEKYENFSGKYFKSLDLSMCKDGIYFLSVQFGDSFVSKKIIFQNN